jgi:hypothetical protein
MTTDKGDKILEAIHRSVSRVQRAQQALSDELQETAGTDMRQVLEAILLGANIDHSFIKPGEEGNFLKATMELELGMEKPGLAADKELSEDHKKWDKHFQQNAQRIVSARCNVDVAEVETVAGSLPLWLRKNLLRGANALAKEVMLFVREDDTVKSVSIVSGPQVYVKQEGFVIEVFVAMLIYKHRQELVV